MVYPIRGSAKPLVDKQPAHACPYNKRRRLVVYYPTIKRILLIPNRGNILNAYFFKDTLFPMRRPRTPRFLTFSTDTFL